MTDEDKQSTLSRFMEWFLYRLQRPAAWGIIVMLSLLLYANWGSAALQGIK